MNDMTVRIRYDAENGMAISDSNAENMVLEIMLTVKVGKAFSVSTENVILAAKALRKEGKIPALVLYFGDKEFVVDDDGRCEGYPDTCLDDWLSRLV